MLNTAQSVRALGVKVYKTKAIYHTLNMFNMDVTQKCLIAECWVPTRDMDRIEEAIEAGRVSLHIQIRMHTHATSLSSLSMNSSCCLILLHCLSASSTE